MIHGVYMLCVSGMLHCRQLSNCFLSPFVVSFQRLACITCPRGNLCTACALHAHCALLLDYVPSEEPPSTSLGNTLRIR